MGATALGVAAARAAATESETPLISDRFARVFLDAAAGAVRQVVILAAGLDSRAWRLPWPDGVARSRLPQTRPHARSSETMRRLRDLLG